MAMADQRLSVHDRVAALDRLDKLAWELNSAAAWLSGNGIETEADKLEQAATTVLAACWLLSRPIRAQPPPERWQQPAAEGR
jgi:hypothetical protein